MHTRRYRMAVLVAVAAGLGAALALRYGLIEPPAVGLACQAAGPPWWCRPRQAVIEAFHAGALGLASLGFGVAALLPWRVFGGARLKRLWAAGDRPRLYAALALGLGAAGLVLYDATLAAVGVVLGLIRAARP